MSIIYMIQILADSIDHRKKYIQAPDDKKVKKFRNGKKSYKFEIYILYSVPTVFTLYNSLQECVYACEARPM